MKKKIILGVLAVVVLLGAYGFFKFKFGGRGDQLQSLYLIPNDAIYIVELEDAVGGWKKVSEHPMWAHLRTNAYFAELTENANALDGFLKDNKILSKLVGKRTLLTSAHMYKHNDYDFLFVVDLQNEANLPIQTALTSFVPKGYTLTKRAYKQTGYEILEFKDNATRDVLYMSFIKNNFVGSYRAKLLENAIDQLGAPVIGRDERYLEINRAVDMDGMFRIYFQYAFLDEYMKAYMSEPNEYVDAISEQIFYTGLNCDLTDDNIIKMDGYTNINDTIDSYLLAMLKSGKGGLDITKIAPQRTAFYMGLGFDSFLDFIENFEDLMKKTNEDYEEYQGNIEKVEKFMKINLKEHFFGWVDDELAFIQTQPGKLGKNNEFAFVLKAKSGEEATENLKYVCNQVRKKTPVKFKEIDYKGYKINFLSVKGFFKLMLGKFFSKLEKPYFTVIDDYVVFSNHPQTLKSIIDDYEAKKTLAESEEFQKFKEEFNDESNVFFYVQTPVLHDNLKEFVSRETWTDLEKNKPYVVCFAHVGFQLAKDGDMFSTRMASLYQDPSAVAENLKAIKFEKGLKNGQFGEVTVKGVNGQDSVIKVDAGELIELVEVDDVMAIEEISPDDLSADEYKEHYEDGTLKLQVGLKDGLKHGTYYEYHPNGQIKFKGKFYKDKKDGVWKEYDENGERINRVRYREGRDTIRPLLLKDRTGAT